MVLGRIARAHAPLTLRQVAAFADPVTDPHEFVRQLVGEVEALSEMPGVIEALAERMEPDSFPVQRTSLSALYGIVRALRPTTVLETGVSIGVSTAVILAALDKNGHGHLHSVDISADVGRVARGANTDRWTLHVHPHVGGERAMRLLVQELREIDVYYHDSGHSWLWQTFEYETVVPHVTGVVLSDDVDASSAFAEHCAAGAVRPHALVEAKKVFAGYKVQAANTPVGPSSSASMSPRT